MKKVLWSLPLLLLGAYLIRWISPRTALPEAVAPALPSKQPPGISSLPTKSAPVVSPAELPTAVISPPGQVQPGKFQRIEAPPPPPVQIPSGYGLANASAPATQEAEAIALNLRNYGQRFGGNPIGTNAEIVKTLNGGNTLGVRYLPQDHLRLNDQGELLDHYGMPYFFHALSATEMEIRSAGADKTLWTGDDILVK